MLPPGAGLELAHLYELLHQGDEVFLVEGAGAIGPAIEESPHLAVVFDGVEQQLLLDEVLVQEFLIEGADGTFEGIGYAKIFRGHKLRRGGILDLEETAAYVDLRQVHTILMKRGG